MLVYALGALAVAGWLTAAYLGMIVCEQEEQFAKGREMLFRWWRGSPASVEDKAFEEYDARQY